MEEGLLTVERIVLESIARMKKNLNELKFDTSLEISVLKNILENFLSKEIILFDEGIYSLNHDTKEGWLLDINKKENIKEEVKDLFNSVANQYFRIETSSQYFTSQVGLKVKKIFMSQEEEVVFQAYLRNFSKFLDSLKGYKEKGERLCNQYVIIHGFAPYFKILDDIMHGP